MAPAPPVVTEQQIDVEPVTTRMTRRQSKEKEDREKAEADAAAIKNAPSSSSSSFSSSSSSSSSMEEPMEIEDNGQAEVKSPRSTKAKAKAAATKAKAEAAAAKAAVTKAEAEAAAAKKAAAIKAEAEAAAIKKAAATKAEAEAAAFKKAAATKAEAAAAKKAAAAAVKAKKAAAAVPKTKTPRAKAKAKEKEAPTVTASSSSSSLFSLMKSRPGRRKMKRSDPAQCLQIIAPMYDLFYEQEEENFVKSYMSAQKDINNRMRGILVDWLVEVHYKFRLQSPTLWLCCNLLDRYLEKKPLLRNKLQLLGVTCLLVACKFEEIYPPEVRDCVYITDKAYSRDEVLTMEQSILSVLDYQLCMPTGYHFMTRYLNIVNAAEKTRHLAFYYAERNLQESISFNHKPSLLMAAALYAALVSDYQDNVRYDSEDEEQQESPLTVWPDLLVEETGYDESDLLPVAKVLLRHVGEEPVTTSMRHLIAAKKKYLNDKFFNVAELALPTL